MDGFMEETKMDGFKIGDKVRLTSNYEAKGKKGMVGIVRTRNKGSGSLGIEFDSSFDGHNLAESDATLNNRHGYWVAPDHVELYSRKGGRKVKTDDRKYIVFGTGCNNMSFVITGEDQAKETAKSNIESGDWSGEIWIVELKPTLILNKKTTYRFTDPNKKTTSKKKGAKQ